MTRTQRTILRNGERLSAALRPCSIPSPETKLAVAVSSLLMEEPVIHSMLVDQILRTSLMPRPLVRQGPGRRSATILDGRSQEPAPIEKRDGVPPFTPLGIDHFMDCCGCRVQLDFHPQFLPGYSADAIRGRLLKANHAAWKVPTRPVECIITPGEQRPTGIILDEQIDID